MVVLSNCPRESHGLVSVRPESGFTYGYAETSGPHHKSAGQDGDCGAGGASRRS